MNAGIATLSLIPVRAEASHRSEMTSQVMFGETFEVLDNKNDWLFVKLADDSYTGWIERKMIAPLSPEDYLSLKSQAPFYAVDVISSAQEVGGEYSFPLLLGSRLTDWNSEESRFGIINKKYFFTGMVQGVSGNGNRTNLLKIARKYLNAPYLWGGRSPFGIDCSGLVQNVYKINGVFLPRDAKDQVREGTAINFLAEAQTGDLAFFDNEEGEIVHVGMLIDNHNIIHASGRVRVDKFDQQGIFNVDEKKYTHRLRVIKSLF